MWYGNLDRWLPMVIDTALPDSGLNNTVWKFSNFPATLILLKINFT